MANCRYECGQVHLLVRMHLATVRVGPIDQPVVGNDPLPIERTKAVAHRRDARRRVSISDVWFAASIARQTLRYDSFRCACRPGSPCPDADGRALPSRSSALVDEPLPAPLAGFGDPAQMTQVRPGITPEPL